MVLKLYGVPLSQPVRAVLWALENTKTPYEFVKIMPGSNKAGGGRHPDFLKISPQGNVPAIDHDGFVLTESHAILTYLANHYGWDDLYPTSPKVRAQVDEYLHWHHRNTRETTLALFAPIMRPDLKITPATIAAGKSKLAGIFNLLEQRLGNGDYIVGNSPTIADLAAYCEVGQCKPSFFGLYDFSGFPRITSWLTRMESVPGHNTSHEMVKSFSPKLKKIAERMDAKL